jgi:hypothetical protein
MVTGLSQTLGTRLQVAVERDNLKEDEVVLTSLIILDHGHFGFLRIVIWMSQKMMSNEACQAAYGDGSNNLALFLPHLS